jgi:hypothetical protein
MHRVTLYTSVPPRLIRQSQRQDYGDAYQRECINSWREAGFRIVSLNPDCEIDALRGKRYDVEFISNGRSQDRTTIGAFFSTILASRDHVAGIINADCFLMNPGMAIGNLLKAAEGSIVLLERLNIDPTTMRATGSSNLGFDAFFFDTRFIANIDDGDDWTIGEPVWDYWCPVVMHVAGAKLKAPKSPIIVHLNHEHEWRIADSVARGSKLCKRLLTLDSEGRLPVTLTQQIRKINLEAHSDQIDVRRFWECIIPWLRTFPETFPLCQSGSPGDFVCRMLAGMASSKEFAFEHQLNTVTLGYWIQSKRRAFSRVKAAVLAHPHCSRLSRILRNG